jgi:hypothetical protein
LISNEINLDLYGLAVTIGIKEMLAFNGFTKEKILNTTVNNLADALDLDYVALNIYKSTKN